MSTQNSIKAVKEWIKQIETDKTKEIKHDDTRTQAQSNEIELDHLMIREALQEAKKWKELFYKFRRSAGSDQLENFELKQEIMRLTQELQGMMEKKEKVEKRLRKASRIPITPKPYKGHHR